MDIQNYPSNLIFPFTYIVDSGSISGNAQAQVTLQMASDCTFELLGFLASATSDAETETIPNGFSVTIQDQSTGRLMSNANVPQRMFASSTYNPMTYEKYPIRFPANCALLFTILDLTGSTNRVIIGLKGYKLYQGA